MTTQLTIYDGNLGIDWSEVIFFYRTGNTLTLLFRGRAEEVKVARPDWSDARWQQELNSRSPAYMEIPQILKQQDALRMLASIKDQRVLAAMSDTLEQARKDKSSCIYLYGVPVSLDDAKDAIGQACGISKTTHR